MRVLLATISIFILASCSTSEERGSPSNRPNSRTLPQYDYDNQSTADGYSYYGDGMMIRTPMTNSAPNWRPMRFFFKDCSVTEQKFYYSKTAYDCTYP